MDECCLCGFALKSSEELEYHIEDSHSDIFNFEAVKLQDVINHKLNDKLQDEKSNSKQNQKENIISTKRISYPRTSKAKPQVNNSQINYSRKAITELNNIECSGHKQVLKWRNKTAKCSKKPNSVEAQSENSQGSLKMIKREIIDSKSDFSTAANLQDDLGKIKNKFNFKQGQIHQS